nr:hypothetical protein [Tanacetum cinerariifolium]
MPKLKYFIALDEQLTHEDIMAQVKEMKRLAGLKAKKDKLEESLKRIMNLTNIKAQAQKIAKYEAKRAKMLKEYNDCINQRANELPITKIRYRVSFSNDATMRITRGNDPLNVVVHDKFIFKTLGLSEWLKVYASTFKTKSNSNDQLLKNLRAKFQNLAPLPGVEGRRGLVIREPEAGIFYYNGNFDPIFQRKLKFHLATTV